MPSRSTAAQLNGNKHSLWTNTLFGNLVSASGTTPTGDERHHTQNTRYLHGFDDERRRPLYLRSASIIAFYRYNIKWTHQLLFGTFGASLAGQRRATDTTLVPLLQLKSPKRALTYLAHELRTPSCINQQREQHFEDFHNISPTTELLKHLTP
ncbi:hypothetical protein B0H11DRAFT_2264886 [Mycena galericulata]|nr:hypothetical protein B0H11DRAFT_2264886 [Mycena galericulata]